MGRLANFHAWPLGDFPVSDFPDLRTTTVQAAGKDYEYKKVWANSQMNHKDSPMPPFLRYF